AVERELDAFPQHLTSTRCQRYPDRAEKNLEVRDGLSESATPTPFPQLGVDLDNKRVLRDRFAGQTVVYLRCGTRQQGSAPEHRAAATGSEGPDRSFWTLTRCSHRFARPSRPRVTTIR